jgi:hypothetical protein
MLLAAAAPATAGYKLLIKGPVCSGPGYCATGELAGNGAISVAMPAYDDPNTAASPDMPALTFTGNVNLQQTVSQMCKPGTNGQPEWLQAGSNVKGAIGTLTATDASNVVYALALTFDPKVNPNTVCNASTLGQESVQYLRGYSITKSGRPQTIVVSNGEHYIYNVAAIPEPETLLLLMAGLGAMAFVVRRKRR